MSQFYNACIIFIVLLNGVFVNAADLTDIQSKALENRRAIKRGHIVFDFTIREGQVSQHRVVEIFFDDNKIRGDMQFPYVKQPKDAKEPFYTEISCFSGNEHYNYSDRIMPDGGRMVLAIRDLKRTKPESPFLVVDPRMLGMAPWDLLQTLNYSLDSFVALPKAKVTDLKRTTKNGIDCWQIEYETPDSVIVRMWIAPSMNYSVIRMEQEFEGSKGRYLDSIDLDVKKHEKSGIWFPVSSHYKRTENGTEITREEHLRATVHSLNEPLEPNIFTLAKMNIPPGTPVMRVPEEIGMEESLWDGKEIINVATAERTGVVTPKDNSSRLILMIFSGILFLIAVGLFFWRHRQAMTG